MKPLQIDKIASVADNLKLGPDVRIGSEFPCQEGDLVAVRVLTRKQKYNALELSSGRFSELKIGDLIVGALGHRKAVFGYAGRIPETLEVGDPLQILNLGGVLGDCTSFTPELGRPIDCEVLGQVLHFPFTGERRAVTANIKQGALPLTTKLAESAPPIIAIAGTSMNSGKTFACSALVQSLTHRGYRVAAAKATGVSLRRDVLAMQDAGAFKVTTFTDFGAVTTTDKNAAAIARSMLSHLARSRPDVIVLELGDGLMGPYGVDSILAAPDLRAGINAHVLAAHDIMGTKGAIDHLTCRHGITLAAVTGPVTDNAIGQDLVENSLQVPAANARLDAETLLSLVLPHIENRSAAAAH